MASIAALVPTPITPSLLTSAPSPSLSLRFRFSTLFPPLRFPSTSHFTSFHTTSLPILTPACRSQLTTGMKTSHRGELQIFESEDDLVFNLADYVAELSEEAVKERGYFAVALSGGSLISLLRKLYEPPHLRIIDWSRWHVFWADERVVPRTHPDSNYKLAKAGLLSKVPILPSQVYPINDTLSAELAAEDYEFGLRQLVKAKIVDVSRGTDCPRLDLILLGMGPDGHVASLFPGHSLTHEKEKWITFITDSPKPPPERITFTFPVINSAANVAMVVTGAGKADVLARVFGEELTPGVLPAQMVSPVNGKLEWFLDKEAASKLPSSAQPSEDPHVLDEEAAARFPVLEQPGEDSRTNSEL